MRAACDIGGTFTDLVIDTGAGFLPLKAPTTNEPPPGAVDPRTPPVTANPNVTGR